MRPKRLLFVEVHVPVDVHGEGTLVVFRGKLTAVARESSVERGPVSLSVVIMAFNERPAIEAQVRATLGFLDRHGSNGSQVDGPRIARGEVVAVDDGSTDGTGEVLDALAREDARVRVVHHARNLGMGVAIRSGYQAASLDFVTQLPGDGQVHPDILGRFLPLLPGHDLVLSTYARRQDGVGRFLVTRAYWLTAWLLLGDPCRFTGTMVFRRALLERIRITSETFLVNVEVPLKLMRLGVRPAWVTIEGGRRAHGRSKVLSARGVARVLREMLALRREVVLTSRWNG